MGVWRWRRRDDGDGSLSAWVLVLMSIPVVWGFSVRRGGLRRLKGVDVCG